MLLDNKPHRLLITRHDKIGDFVLTLPLCKALKNTRPDTEITVLVSKVNYEFARSLDFIDHVLLYQESFFDLLREIRSRKFDASISAYIDIKLGLVLWASGIPIRIAPATKFAQIFFNKRVLQRRSLASKTEWQYNLDLADTLFASEKLTFEPPLIDFEGISKKNRVVFHPGFGGSSEGNLRLQDYLRLARLVSLDPDIEVVFTFGPNDHDSLLKIRQKLDFRATLIESDMPLLQFCRFLAESRLFVSTSTGPMHLAGAVNTPSISFFGDSLFASSRRWGTISQASKQKNFMLPKNYPEEIVEQIETALLEMLA